MIRIYYQNLKSDCSYEQSLLLCKDIEVSRLEKINKLKNKDVAKKKILISYFLQQVLSKEMGIPMGEIRFQYGLQGKPELDYDAMQINMEARANTDMEPSTNTDMKLSKNADMEPSNNMETSTNTNMNPVSQITMGAGIESAMQITTRNTPQPIHFNMSHSGDYVVVAVSDEPIGIDIEHKTRNYETVAKRCFHKAEYDSIMKLNEPDRSKRFLEIWTMKEAYIKWKGDGMKIPFSGFNVLDGTCNTRTINIEETKISDLYVLSLCTKKSTIDVIFVEVPVFNTIYGCSGKSE
ncbi:MAG: 4'-phosphopantetheinyl transferase family protein [Lachnospiraceae bacterium]